MSIEKKTSDPTFVYSFVCGGIGQATEIITFGHLLNRVATEQQAQPQLSIRQTLSFIWNKGGVPEYYRGLRWNLLLGMFKGASRWGLNNSLYAFYDNKVPTTFVPFAVGITGAFLETTLILCPLESLKTREMTKDWKGPIHMWSVVRSEGTFIFFRGWQYIFARQSITWATYLVVYDYVRYYIMKYRMKKSPASFQHPQLTISDKFLIGSCTGAISCALNNPLDMLKTQFQKDNPLSSSKKSFIAPAKQIWQQFGLRGFYSSLGTRMLRSSWYSVSTLIVMDYLDALPNRMKL